jgi:thiol-disulfide isomerase/thioredoxin
MNGCPHCETILPEYKKFAAAGQVQMNGKKVKIRMLEQGDPNAAPEIEARNVKGFPTFVLATADGQHLEYQGERSIPAIGQFISQNAS